MKYTALLAAFLVVSLFTVPAIAQYDGAAADKPLATVKTGGEREPLANPAAAPAKDAVTQKTDVETDANSGSTSDENKCDKDKGTDATKAADAALDTDVDAKAKAKATATATATADGGDVTIMPGAFKIVWPWARGGNSRGRGHASGSNRKNDCNTPAPKPQAGTVNTTNNFNNAPPAVTGNSIPTTTVEKVRTGMDLTPIWILIGLLIVGAAIVIPMVFPHVQRLQQLTNDAERERLRDEARIAAAELERQRLNAIEAQRIASERAEADRRTALELERLAITRELSTRQFGPSENGRSTNRAHVDGVGTFENTSDNRPSQPTTQQDAGGNGYDLQATRAGLDGLAGIAERLGIRPQGAGREDNLEIEVVPNQ